MCGKGYIWNPATCSSENSYAGSVVDNSVITSDEIIEKTKSILTKTVPINLNRNRRSLN